MAELPYLIVFLLVIAFLLRIDFIFYIVYVCLGLYAWGKWVTPWLLTRVRAQRSYRDHAFLGERIVVQLTLENQSRLPIPWLQFAESVPAGLGVDQTTRQVVNLPGSQSITTSYHIQAMRRGYYRLGPLFLSAGDLFGFGESQGKVAPNYLTVYPRIVRLSRLGLPSRLPFGTVSSRQRLFEDPARPTGVRNYLSGDSLRYINWKVSAHTENLLVKTFEPAISLETVLFLNLNQEEFSNRNRYDGPEWAIVVAASLANHLSSQRQSVGLSNNGLDPLAKSPSDLAFDTKSGRLLASDDDSQGSLSDLPQPIPPRPGRENLMKILEQLARLEAHSTISFHDWAPRACVSLSWGTTIVAVTPTGNEKTCQVLHRFARAGYNPVLIVTDSSTGPFGQVRRRAQKLGFVALEVTKEQDLDMWRKPESAWLAGR